MNLVTPSTLAQWMFAAGPFLRRHEAEHGLMLGLAANTTTAPGGSFWGYVEEDGAVVAAALGLSRERLLLSRGPSEAVAVLARASTSAERYILRGPAECVAAAAAASGRSCRDGLRQGIYELRRVVPPRPTPGHARQATPGDTSALRAWTAAFHAEALPDEPARSEEQLARSVALRLEQRQLFVWEDAGEPVAMTGVSGATRGTGTPGGGLRVNAVYTPPALRGKGYASALVAHVSQWILDSGYAFSFLYTDLTNPISNAIYQRLGYEWVAGSHEVLLGEVPAGASHRAASGGLR